jgi:hypothetical protein
VRSLGTVAADGHTQPNWRPKETRTMTAVDEELSEQERAQVSAALAYVGLHIPDMDSIVARVSVALEDKLLELDHETDLDIEPEHEAAALLILLIERVANFTIGKVDRVTVSEQADYMASKFAERFKTDVLAYFDATVGGNHA